MLARLSSVLARETTLVSLLSEFLLATEWVAWFVLAKDLDMPTAKVLVVLYQSAHR